MIFVKYITYILLNKGKYHIYPFTQRQILPIFFYTKENITYILDILYILDQVSAITADLNLDLNLMCKVSSSDSGSPTNRRRLGNLTTDYPACCLLYFYVDNEM